MTKTRRRFLGETGVGVLAAMATGNEVLAKDNTRGLAQDQFAIASSPVDLKGDFSTDGGALAYANAQLDRLFSAIRYSIEKHVVGWPLSEEERALNTYEALRHTFRNLSLAHAGHLEADYSNPTLTKMGGMSRIQFQQQSPDCNYHMALLHGDYRYRLKGFRGTAAIFQAAVYKGHSCDFKDGWQELAVANNFDNPQFAPGNDIDVVLSREKPADLGDALWLQLPPGRCELHLRQYYADWENELPADLMLIHMDQTFPSRDLDKQSFETRYQRVVDFMTVHSDFYRKGVQGHLDANPHEIEEYKVPGAFVGTTYYHGHFRCQPGQAVVIDIPRPQATYWNVTLDQMQWEPGDWWSKLVSYNGSQVHQRPDGSVRLIAAWMDPGVANWLDCSGRALNLISFRFFRSQATDARPRLTVVPIEELAGFIGVDTPRVSAQERASMMHKRLISTYRRRFSDF